MKLENGRSYVITNRHNQATIVRIKNNQVHSENGAHCGSVDKFCANPLFATLKIKEVGAK